MPHTFECFRAAAWLENTFRTCQFGDFQPNTNGVPIAPGFSGDFSEPMSKRILKIGVPFAVILGGLIMSSPSSFGKAEYTKKEGKGCTYCHTAAGKKDLNDVGKCYAEHNHTLEGCAPKS